MHTHILDYGIRALRSRHRKIRELKRLHNPSCHGFRIWPSSWLLMDYLKHKGLPKNPHILELGCGWGLAGVYCAKNHGAVVTGMDIDAEVFPYLGLHAHINGVEIKTMKLDFDELTVIQLKEYDVLIGTDICFLDTMIGTLRQLILRAVGTGIQTVFIADPGRSSFETLGQYFIEKGKGDMRNWSVDHPHPIQGRILRIDLQV